VSSMRFLIRILGSQLRSRCNYARCRKYLSNTIFPGKIWYVNSKTPCSVKERIRLKSQVLVEDSILEIFSIIHNKDNAIPARLDAFKQLARVAEVDAPDRSNADTGSRFTVSINLGETYKPVVIEGDSNA
jgi:hypothetical protein